MVSHARTAAQRREQTRFAGRLCKMVELRHEGFVPTHALLRAVADYKARAERPRADPGTQTEDDAVHSVVLQERNSERIMEQTLDAPVPQVMNFVGSSMWRPRLPSPEGGARPTAPLPHLVAPMQRLSRGSNTCLRHLMASAQHQ